MTEEQGHGAPELIRVPFNGAFREANATRARYRLLCGSAGSGKSYNAAQDFILKLSDRKFAGAGAQVPAGLRAGVFRGGAGGLCGILPKGSRPPTLRRGVLSHGLTNPSQEGGPAPFPLPPSWLPRLN